MRCSKAKRLISDYIDGTLKTKKQLRLESHLGVCPECKLLLTDFRALVNEAKELERPLPSDKAWAGILARLNRRGGEKKIPRFERQRKWVNIPFARLKMKYALASILILAIIVGGLIFGLLQSKGKEFLARGELENLSLAKLNEAELYCQLAVKALNEAISAQKGSLDPQLEDVFRKNLELIDSSIEACQHAIDQNPQNIAARSYLLSAYREKIAFLTEVVEVKKQSSPKMGVKTTI